MTDQDELYISGSEVAKLLHVSPKTVSRAVAAAEAMEVAFDAMVREAGVNDIGDPPGPQPNDWAKRVQALAAASRACGELARTRLLLAEAEQEMTYDDWATFELIARERDQLKVWLPTIAEQAIDLYQRALAEATSPEQARVLALTEVAEGINSATGDAEPGQRGCAEPGCRADFRSCVCTATEQAEEAGG